MHNISLFQNERNWVEIKDRVWDLVQEDHMHGRAQKGSLTFELEKRLAKAFNRTYCVTTASCSDALTIALIALKLPTNSQVAVANYTFSATANAVMRAGHTVVPVDVTDNYCIDVNKIPADCAAVIAVDLFGNMSNWDELNKLSIPVICDAAQSLESHNGNAASPQCGLISCVSFAPSKTVSSWGSGGAILTDSFEIADYADKLRLHGKKTNNQVSVHPGMNSMMSSFESACVIAGLEQSIRWQARRLEIAKYLIAASRFPTNIDINLTRHTLHKLVFLSDTRDQTVLRLRDAGVESVVHYKPLVADEALYKTDVDMYTSNLLKSKSFTVPNQHTLTDVEVEQIAKALK